MRQLKINITITKKDGESLEVYFGDIGKISLLSLEQESLVAKKAREGDVEAMTLMILSNLRFVVSVAKKYQHHGLPLADLINEGNLGLIKAAKQFNETLGFRFISFAVWWIRQYMIHAIGSQTRTIRLPINKINSIARINRQMAILEQKLERDPSIAEIAEAMEWPEAKIADYLDMARLSVSLDSIINEEIGNTLLDILHDGESPDHNLMKIARKEEVKRMLNILRPRERKIIILFYGLEDKEPVLLDDIAPIVGLSKERVRQLRDKAIKELRRRKKDLKRRM
ncbi:sigma-70 family RNA polymerase sigma factor [Pedobacter nutrimenti]|jgi:RNA polymerase primary sigma factor|uniref:RNA polymerase RpoS-like sigma 38 subunit n=1 Tax=Pedobacter nutrimenti TaxID=1241337 RepID=A0A318ULI0_9SPHI|nr:RNA polymerase sigma factor RpoD/SigA [Pedobacter nutrimenti]PYF76943.1 RNA polymerase RpoS-like sigma 38 subunit [Pedobacter nutrimenti]